MMRSTQVRQRPRRLIRWLLPVAALLLLALVVNSVPVDAAWRVLHSLRAADLLLLAAVNTVIFAGLTLRWWLMLRAQGHQRPLASLLRYRLTAFGISYFTPGPHFGGEPFQVYVLSQTRGKRGKPVPYSAAVASVALDKIVELLANFAFLCLGLIIVLATSPFADERVALSLGETVVLLFSAALPVVLLLAVGRGWFAPSKALRWLLRRGSSRRRSDASQALAQEVTQKLTQGDAQEQHTARVVRLYRLLRRSEARLTRTPLRVLANGMLLSIGLWLLMVGEFWFMTSALGMQLSPIHALTVLVAQRIAYLLPAPAAVGTLEGGLVLATVAVGGSGAAGLSLALLIRVRDVLMGLIGLALAAHQLWPRRVRHGDSTAVRSTVHGASSVPVQPRVHIARRRVDR